MSDSIHVIARIHSDFPTKFGIPRQSGLVDALQSSIVFEPEYRNPEVVRGLEGFSHIWLIWQFSQAVREGWSPRCGRRGWAETGGWSLRNPISFRPNALGLSAVRLTAVEAHTSQGPVLHVAGADLMDGTPIYDIKPYLPYADALPEAAGGFTDQTQRRRLTVDCPASLLAQIPEEKLPALLGVLAEDPRPPYQNDPNRIYGMAFGGLEVRFTVEGERLTVLEIAAGEKGNFT